MVCGRCRSLLMLMAGCFVCGFKFMSFILFLCHFFQVINNACATQAIISVLLNCTHSDMLLGETLTEFREFSQSFDGAVRKWYFHIFAALFWVVIREGINDVTRISLSTSAFVKPEFHYGICDLLHLLLRWRVWLSATLKLSDKFTTALLGELLPLPFQCLYLISF